MSQITKGSKVSSKTYSNQLNSAEIECIQCKQDMSSWNKTPAEFLLEEFLKQIFINEFTDQEKVEEIEHMCQKCLIKKYFDDNTELYQKFCRACSLELQRKETLNLKVTKPEGADGNVEKPQNNEMNKTCILPKLNYTMKDKSLEYRKTKEFQEKYQSVINHYSKEFPNPVIPKEVEMKWQKVYDTLFGDELRRKVESWYYCVPTSTMKDSFRPHYSEYKKDKIKYHKKKSEFSSYVDASFKGGVIDRPLLDPVMTTSELDLNDS